jgi:hypothetical protein
MFDVFFTAARGQQNHGRLRRLRRIADIAEHLKTVDLGHFHITHDQIGQLSEHGEQAFCAVIHVAHFMTGFLKHRCDQSARRGFIF